MISQHLTSRPANLSKGAKQNHPPCKVGQLLPSWSNLYEGRERRATAGEISGSRSAPQVHLLVLIISLLALHLGEWVLKWGFWTILSSLTSQLESAVGTRKASGSQTESLLGFRFISAFRSPAVKQRFFTCDKKPSCSFSSWRSPQDQGPPFHWSTRLFCQQPTYASCCPEF